MSEEIGKNKAAAILDERGFMVTYYSLNLEAFCYATFDNIDFALDYMRKLCDNGSELEFVRLCYAPEEIPTTKSTVFSVNEGE